MNSPTETPTTMSSISHLTTRETTGLTSESTTHNTMIATTIKTPATTTGTLETTANRLVTTVSTQATTASTLATTNDSSDHDTVRENTTEVPTSLTSTVHNSTTAMPISSKTDMLWVNLLMAGVVIVLVIVFVVCFIIFYHRYRTLQKQGKYVLSKWTLSLLLTYAAHGNTTEGAALGGRAGSQLQKITYNEVTLKVNNELQSSSVPSSQINYEGEMLLYTSFKGN